EESDTTLIVTPYVYPDGVDGYLVTDGRENQVRRYTTDGRLEWQFGRTGAGPGEFRDPRAAVRSPDGRILVGQFNGRFTILEESDTALIVTPYVYPDGVDGYLVTDGRENQVRRYTTDGRLEWQFGRTGAGPGEFRDPRAAVRSPDGRILVGQFNGRFTILDD